jgi:hypothetical protein
MDAKQRNPHQMSVSALIEELVDLPPVCRFLVEGQPWIEAFFQRREACFRELSRRVNREVFPHAKKTP